MRALFFGAMIAMAVTAFAEEVGYRVQLDTIHRGYDGKMCWVHARAGAIPNSSRSVVLTMQKLLLTGSDVFYALNDMRTDDMGKTWSGPTEHADTLGRRDEADGVVVAACDFWPKWHAATGTMLGIGHTVRYRDNRAIHVTPRQTTYAIYDPERRDWTPWTTLAMPNEPRFANAGAGCVQRVDLPNGDILLPIYFKLPEAQIASVTVVRCHFDGRRLEYVEHGIEITVPVPRGFAEPSLTVFNGRYYLTLRNDEHGYVTSSSDGLHFDPPRTWQCDDGSDLGNYNTQQHWVTHSDALFLVYTRRGADNDHVFRHRAPLFIGQVDPQTLRVKRATERVLVPQRGARLGNFGVVDVGPNETWVTVTEWMQKKGPNIVIPTDNQYGADNSVYAARIIWDRPNATWNQR